MSKFKKYRENLKKDPAKYEEYTIKSRGRSKSSRDRRKARFTSEPIMTRVIQQKIDDFKKKQRYGYMHLYLSKSIMIMIMIIIMNIFLTQMSAHAAP